MDNTQISEICNKIRTLEPTPNLTHTPTPHEHSKRQQAESSELKNKKNRTTPRTTHDTFTLARLVKELKEVQFVNHKIEMSNRVDIKGQFNFDNIFSSWNRAEVVIDRQIDLSPIPRNWITFCADADEALREVTKAKSFHRNFGTLSYIILAAYIVFVPFSNNVVFQVIAALAVFIPFLTIWLSTRSKLKFGMNKLEQTCQSHSGKDVQYVLGNEYWGNCNKPNVKRYFVIVTQTDGDLEYQQPTITASIANAAPGNSTGPRATSSNPELCDTNPYLQEPSSTPVSASSAGTSMFDQLLEK